MSSPLVPAELAFAGDGTPFSPLYGDIYHSSHGGLDQADLGPRRESHWIADHRISTGGCVVEGRDRIIDGRVDTALERAYRRLAYTSTNA